MSIYEHLTEFAGLPVLDFPTDGTDAVTPPDRPVAWRIATEFEGVDFDEVFQDFLTAVDTTEVTALVIGFWGASYDDGAADPAALLTGAAERLPNLRSLFLGDIVSEEAEISWIEQSDITPLLTAFPRLERLEVRGGTGLALDPVRNETLTTLRFEAGGLPAGVVRAVGASDLPALEHLQLWLGVDDYSGDATVADLAPLLTGERLPALRHLGLQNSQIQDEIAAAVAGAPVVAGLESLSLAMGVLTDEGAEALLSGQPLTHLKRLDLHHHFLGDEMVKRVRAALPDVDVDLSEHQRPRDEWRYVAVSE
ncbi:STM4015 family protein [Actinomadura sp. HBU206391]|uniref:STM4015 family protein n=1 Tax=Actinomadura sp. HBU206391 TaxID=2731692 RepID=UPI00164F1E4C|nr:STM4015 family protein [Actinomadura sp. HBU206391]MBC6459038.1 STM4015 family protein [Actinomadura sp. HBU206391]